jgi:dihydrodipicolinate synthase/N-acetylneuraminate lyase
VKIHGVIPPVITSFTADGQFDEAAQREVIRFLTPKVNGFYPIGTYGSGPLMTVEERKRAAEVILDEVHGRVPVIVHVGSINTAQTVELAKHAERSGADAVGAIPPYYYRYPDEDLRDHFRAVIDAVRIPVFVYNNPGLSNNPISVEMVNALAKEGLSGLKDSSFDLIQFYNYLNGIERPDFIHIIGTEALAAAAVHAGAHGIISGLANVWPELMAQLWQALESNDGRAAGEMQRRVLEARAILKYGPTLVTCYEVLKMRGVNAGYPKRPYAPLSEELKRKVRDDFLQMGLFAE